jgi:membrane associated rhomboid family serine protease
MMLIPYRVDVPLDCRPIMNWLLIASVIGAFALQVTVPDEESVNAYVLDGWTLNGLFGHMYLHGGLFHLGGNMLFLWVFGNAVCSKIGNVCYVPCYFFFGILAAAAHLLFNGEPMVGASGAINGVVGMFLVFYGLNEIDCLFFIWIIRPIAKTFSVSSFWMILYWLVFDIAGAVMGGGNVAYFAHLGGFASGAILAVILLKFNIVKMQPDEKSLVEVLERWLQERQDARLQKEAEKHVEKAKNEVQREVQPKSAAEPKETMIRFLCPCGQRIKVPLELAGKQGKCPHCHYRITVPIPPLNLTP